MNPSFRERLRDKLDKYYGSDLNDKIDKTWDEVQEQAVAEILSLVRGIVSKVYNGRYPELGDAPIEVMHFAKAILNEIGDGDATRKHDGGL